MLGCFRWKVSTLRFLKVQDTFVIITKEQQYRLTDANYTFLYVDVGVNGRNSDGRVFRESSPKKAMEQKLLQFPEDTCLPKTTVKMPYVFMADDAFPLRPNKTGSNYWCYLNQFSLVLLATIGPVYKFTSVDIGSFGQNEPSPHVIIGDEAFALKPYLLGPFRTNKVIQTFLRKTLSCEKSGRKYLRHIDNKMALILQTNGNEN
nr:unnamed protein product [Callosobruchus analis]